VSRVLSVVGLACGPDGSGYYRMYLPFKNLAANSRHLVMIPPPGRTPPMPTRADLEDVDVFIAQRPVGAAGMRTWDNLEGVTARVYEVDDDLLNVDPSGLAHLCDDRIRDSIRYILARSEMVTVSTPFLAEKCAQYNPNVRVLPNMINAELMDLPRRRRDKVTVGWAGGSSHLADMAYVQDPLRAVLDRHPGVDMHFVGMDYSPLLHRECLWTGWSGDVWDYYRAVDFDIGLAPLADIPFNYSKSHLKALDYAAMGIPVIAQDMPPYREFVQDGVTGYLVGSHAEWEKRLDELIGDEAARLEMGANAKALAAKWTIQGNWQRWEAAYEEAAGHGTQDHAGSDPAAPRP
jgi:glycosyltransferase involved in cell wall biosynthesis